MHLPLTVPAGALRNSSFCTVVHQRGLHALPLTLAEVPGGFRLVKVKPQHRNIVERRTQQLSKRRGKGISDFCFCCLVPAIWKTTFLLGNYKSQSALWEEHASYQLVPSTNSQIWIRNQFWKRLTLAGYSPQRLRKGARQHENEVSLQYTKILFKNFFRGEQPRIFCPLEGQHSTALVILELAAVVMEVTFETRLLFQVGKWAAGAAVVQSESDPVSLQMLLINTDLWKDMWAATLVQLC